MNRKILTILLIGTYGCFGSLEDAYQTLDEVQIRMAKMVELAKEKDRISCELNKLGDEMDEIVASSMPEFKDKDKISERVAAIKSELSAEIRELNKFNKMKHDEDEAKCKATQFLDNLGRMRDLAEKASGEILSDADRERVNKEFLESKDEIDRIASSYKTGLNDEQRRLAENGAKMFSDCVDGLGQMCDKFQNMMDKVVTNQHAIYERVKKANPNANITLMPVKEFEKLQEEKKLKQEKELKLRQHKIKKVYRKVEKLINSLTPEERDAFFEYGDQQYEKNKAN